MHNNPKWAIAIRYLLKLLQFDSAAFVKVQSEEYTISYNR